MSRKSEPDERAPGAVTADAPRRSSAEFDHLLAKYGPWIQKAPRKDAMPTPSPAEDRDLARHPVRAVSMAFE